MAEQQNIQDIPQDHNQDVPDEATQFQPIPVPDMLGQEPPAYPAQPPPPPVDLAAFLQNYLTQQAGQQAQLQQTLELLTQVQHAQLQGQFVTLCRPRYSPNRYQEWNLIRSYSD